MTKEKYFRETVRSNDSTSLLRVTQEMLASVDLPIEKYQDISIRLGKNGNPASDSFPPKTGEYCIIKPAQKEDYQQAYDGALRYIHQHIRKEGEFYVIKAYEERPRGIAWFSKDEVKKSALRIEFYDEPQTFSLYIKTAPHWQGVQHFRRSNHPIDPEKFQVFYDIVMDFLFDQSNYELNFPKIPVSFSSLLNGGTVVHESIGEWKVDNSAVAGQIKSRIAAIEKRLIEFDSDSLDERNKMRGELAGLKFSLNLLT